MATASASGIEWLTATNSHSNGPEPLALALARPPACSGVIRCSRSLASTQRQREPRAEQRDVRAQPQQVRHGADVVLVAVREHDGLDVVEAVGDVGRSPAGSGRRRAGGSSGNSTPQSTISSRPSILEDGHVAADLAEPAEGDDPQGAGSGSGGRRAELGVRVPHARVPAAGEGESAARGDRASRWRRRSGRRTGPAGRPGAASAALARITPWVRDMIAAYGGDQRRVELRGRAATSPASGAATIAGDPLAGDVPDDADHARRRRSASSGRFRASSPE